MVVWRPQPGPQKALIDCPLPEIFYGGARGGGKTDGVLGKYALKAQQYGEAFNAVFFRKELPMLDDAIERSSQIYSKIGAEYNEQKKTWRFPGGGRLRFRPLERVADAEKYQGQNITDACVEEAGNYQSSDAIDRLNGVLRSGAGIPTQLLLTGNPGGPGQQWIRKRYIDPAPGGFEILERDLPNGDKHRYVYIPSRLQNNRILMANDPGYLNRLYLVGSAELVKAWLDGDWSAIQGAFFDCWSNEKHVIRPFKIPDLWLRFVSGDWGSASPFSFGWWAVVSDDYEHDGVILPRGALVRYKEWYGEGKKLHAEEVGVGLWERIKDDIKPAYGVLDPSAFAQDGGPSIAERIYKGTGRNFAFRRADNTRVPQKGAMGGWDQMRARLVGNDDGRPMAYCFATCIDSIRTIPALQHDPDRPEDLDTKCEDHAGDDWRYAMLSRPYIKEAPQPIRSMLAQPTFNDILKSQKRHTARGRI